MDRKTREQLISSEANALYEKLRVFGPRDRIFALTEIVRLCQKRLSSRESMRYHLDFSQDEPPTNPTVEENERETRAINVDELRELRKKSEK